MNGTPSERSIKIFIACVAILFSIVMAIPPGSVRGQTGPSLARVSPTSGPDNGGNTINLHGSGFTPSTTVTIDGITATNVTFIDSTRIAATVPADSIGTVADVTATDGGMSSTLAGAYTYLNRNAILFQDSFNGDIPDPWTTGPFNNSNGANFTLTNGAKDYPGSGATQQFAGNAAWTDYTLEAKVQVFSGNNFPGGLRARVQSNDQTLAGGASYEIWLRPADNQVFLFRVGQWNIDGASLGILNPDPGFQNPATVTITPNVFHTIQMSVTGNVIR